MARRGDSGGAAALLSDVEGCVVSCRRCPRLAEWRERVAREKTRRYRDEEYWGRPVPGWGDPDARVLIIGLAPAAHGANRTGRMFTGDRSGLWLYRALHRAGFASRAASLGHGDGLSLMGCYITATARCAPPANKPLPQELENCREYLEREVDALWPRLRVVVPLGRIAFDWWLRYLTRIGRGESLRGLRFGHAQEHSPPGLPVILCSFHPSQQNTQTGRLTEPMFDAIWTRAMELASAGKS